MELAQLLPHLLPKAIAWAEGVERDVVSCGSPLDAPGVADARTVGVEAPEAIRVALVDSLPWPIDSELRNAAIQTGLIGPDIVGLTIGHAIVIRRGHLSRRLLSHECRHVAQYEQSGSIAEFLRRYLGAIAEHGYRNCPFEQDARAHELPDSGSAL